ncbi:hypothetical protein AB7M29_004093 [Pseudomonas sp. F-14 TE3623]
MLRKISSLVAGASLCLTAVPAIAQVGHYSVGAEGLLIATLPPPGVYYRGYLVNYSADTLNDKHGTERSGHNKIDVHAFANQFIWITDYSLLGGNYGMNAIVPIQQQETKISNFGVKGDAEGVGDILLQPITITWHAQQWDAVSMLGVWVKTGDYDSDRSVSIGKGYTSYMFTLGGTRYLDHEKKWAVSATSRYEKNGEQEGTHLTPGDAFSVEWGISRKINPLLDVGLVGYDVWQLTNDSGTSVFHPGTKIEHHAIGGEVQYFWRDTQLLLNAAVYHEYKSEDTFQGDTVRFTVTRRL